MLHRNAESLAELQLRLRALAGTVTLLRSRRFFVARIDRVETSDTGFRYSGELLRRIEEPGLEGSHFPTGDFSWSCTWDLLHGGNGVVYASYVSWCLFYDRELVIDVLRILEANPNADTEAFRAIVAWEATHHQKRR